MKLYKNLSMTIDDETQGTNLTIKTVSNFKDQVAIVGDLGVYPISIIKDCIKEIESFLEKKGSQ